MFLPLACKWLVRGRHPGISNSEWSSLKNLGLKGRLGPPPGASFPLGLSLLPSLSLFLGFLAGETLKIKAPHFPSEGGSLPDGWSSLRICSGPTLSSVNNKKREPISPSFFPSGHFCFATLWFFPLLCGSIHLVVLDILFLSATLWFSFKSFAITNAGRGAATIIQRLRNIITQVEENISKFAKKGLTPSQIGVILREFHGIAQVKNITGSKILRILKANNYSKSEQASEYVEGSKSP